MRNEVIESIVSQSIPEKSYYTEWNSEKLKNDIQINLGVSVPVEKWVVEDGIVEREIIDRIKKSSKEHMAQRVSNIGSSVFREAEKSLLLQVLDQCWKDHLLYLDQLRQSIGLRAYGQKDPLNEYKKEAFDLFEEMLSKISFMIVSIISNFEIQRNEDLKEEKQAASNNLEIKNFNKIPRNSKCPCGSGKKFKHCCGKI